MTLGIIGQGTDHKGVGYVLSHEQFPARQLIEQAVAAERAGFDAVWTSDHFHPWQDNQGHGGHAWITLGAIGQRTSRIVLGTGVTCPTYRFLPADVAHAFSSLATLYPRRVFLGVGTGEAINEFASGGGWGPFRERLSRLREAVQIIRRLWTEDWTTFAGEHYEVPGAKLYCKPESPIPIYIAAGGPNAAGFAGESGDGWITDAGSLLLSQRQNVRSAYREGRAASMLGHDRVPVLVELYAYIGSPEQAQSAAALWQFLPIGAAALDIKNPRAVQAMAEQRSSTDRTLRRWLVSPDPQEHTRRIRELWEGGATHVFVHCPNADQQAAIGFYEQHVLPALR